MINRYLLAELAVPFVLSLVALTFVVLVQQILKLMDLLINKGVGLYNILKAFFLILPSFFLITIPMAVLIASLIAFNRLSFDRELVALKSLGVGFGTLLRPLIIFSTVGSLIAFLLAMVAEPLGGNALKELTYRVIQQRANIGLTEGTFNSVSDQMMIYVTRMPTVNELQGVLISDLRRPDEPLLIIAKRGKISSNPTTQTLQISLEDGTVHQRPRDPKSYQNVAFERYDLTIDLSPLFPHTDVHVPSYRDLIRTIRDSQGKDVNALRTLEEYYKNYTFAFSCLLLGLIGAPLGMIAGRASRLGGFAVAVFLITLYYLISIVGDFLVSSRSVPPFFGAILPILFLLPPLCFLLTAAIQERSPCR